MAFLRGVERAPGCLARSSTLAARGAGTDRIPSHVSMLTVVVEGDYASLRASVNLT
jgi:hypothetical protein